MAVVKSLQAILLDKNWDEPPEIMAIKDFVRKRFNAPVKVALSNNDIVILARSAALAGTLRMHIADIRKVCKTNRKLVIRIG